MQTVVLLRFYYMEWTAISGSQVKSKDEPADEEYWVSDLIFRKDNLISLLLNLEVTFSLEKKDVGDALAPSKILAYCLRAEDPIPCLGV